jgi:hypothetical protein
MSCRPFFLGVFLAVALAASGNAQTPSYMKKYGVIGQRGSLPKGYFLYVDFVGKTIMKMNLQSGEPSAIPNTNDVSTHSTSWLRISPDGNWVLYKSKSLTLIRIDGTGKTVVNDGSSNIYGSQYGFVHNGPNGLEIFYWRDNSDNHTWALKVDLSGKNAVFGAKRIILSSLHWGDDDDYRRQTFVAKNHIYGSGPRWITIPNNGMGTATSGDTWSYSNPGRTSCGHAMSWDGSLVTENPAPPRNIPCIPANGMHVGPVIMPFFEKGSPAIDRVDLWLTKAVSINFCPEEYYADGKHDYHEWNWTNHREYLTCREWISGASPWDPKGVWILHWPTNTWTLMTRPGGHTTAAYILP